MVLCTHHITDHSTNTGVCSAKGLDSAWVIVCLALESNRAAWCKTDDARIAHKCTAHKWCIDAVGGGAQLIDQRWASDAVVGGDRRPKCFVGAMLTPRLRNRFEFDVGW